MCVVFIRIADDKYLTAADHPAAREKIRDLLSAAPQDFTHNDMFRDVPSSLPRPHEIHVPTLILVGDADIPDVHAHAGVIETGIANSRRIEEFRPRTIRSLSNAFTSAFKELEAIPQFQGDGEIGRVSGDAILPAVLAWGDVASIQFRPIRSFPGSPLVASLRRSGFQELLFGQARCLRHEVIPLRNARGAPGRHSIVLDRGFTIADLFE